MSEAKLVRGPQLRKEYLGGIDHSTLWRWRRYRGFPEPIEASATVHLWRLEDVYAWLAAQQSRGAT